MKLAAAAGALLVMIIIAGCAGEPARRRDQSGRKGNQVVSDGGPVDLHPCSRPGLSTTERRLPSLDPINQAQPCRRTAARSTIPTANARTRGRRTVSERDLGTRTSTRRRGPPPSAAHRRLRDLPPGVQRRATAATIPDHARFLAAKAELDADVSKRSPATRRVSSNMASPTCGQPSPGAHSATRSPGGQGLWGGRGVPHRARSSVSPATGRR